jgi:hypothetical protein
MSAVAAGNVIGGAEGSRTCQILILCEDVAAYERASDCCWRILVQLADDLEFTFNCWNFYELSDPDCKQAILRSAKNSDVILLSLHHPDLPKLAADWLDAFAGHRQRSEGALALVLNEPPGSPEAVKLLEKRVEQHALKLGMDFLKLAPAPAKHTRGRIEASATGKRNPGEQHHDHWGLNE